MVDVFYFLPEFCFHSSDASKEGADADIVVCCCYGSCLLFQLAEFEVSFFEVKVLFVEHAVYFLQGEESALCCGSDFMGVAPAFNDGYFCCGYYF